MRLKPGISSHFPGSLLLIFTVTRNSLKDRSFSSMKKRSMLWSETQYRGTMVTSPKTHVMYQMMPSVCRYPAPLPVTIENSTSQLQACCISVKKMLSATKMVIARWQASTGVMVYMGSTNLLRSSALITEVSSAGQTQLPALLWLPGSPKKPPNHLARWQLKRVTTGPLGCLSLSSMISNLSIIAHKFLLATVQPQLQAGDCKFKLSLKAGRTHPGATLSSLYKLSSHKYEEIKEIQLNLMSLGPLRNQHKWHWFEILSLEFTQ